MGMSHSVYFVCEENGLNGNPQLKFDMSYEQILYRGSVEPYSRSLTQINGQTC